LLHTYFQHRLFLKNYCKFENDNKTCRLNFPKISKFSVSSHYCNFRVKITKKFAKDFRIFFRNIPKFNLNVLSMNFPRNRHFRSLLQKWLFLNEILNLINRKRSWILKNIDCIWKIEIWKFPGIEPKQRDHWTNRL